jgi:hypothetical protein
MKYLIYTSHTNNDQQIHDMLNSIRYNNSLYGITGLLLMYDGLIVQLIEGREEVVNRLWKNLLHDKRHYRVMKVLEKKIVNRLFPDWTMGFIDKRSVTNTKGYSNMLRDRSKVHTDDSLKDKIFALNDL